MAAGKPSFTITARVTMIDGEPPTAGHSCKFWVSYFGYTDVSTAQTPVQTTLGGNETSPIAVTPSIISTIDAQYSAGLDNSFTGLWQSLMAGLVCTPTQKLNDTLEIAGTIHVDETGENLPYTARLFKPLQIYGPSNATFMGLMCFRLLPNGKFPTSASDPNGTPHVWPQAKYMQRYMDAVDMVSRDPVPRPSSMQIIMSTNPGDNDRNSWETSYEILRRIGATTTAASSLNWAPAEIARASNIHKFSIGLYNPPGSMFPYRPGNPGGASPQVPDAPGIAAWAQYQVDTHAAAGYTSAHPITHFNMADEPGAYQPYELDAINNTYGPSTSGYMRDENTRQAFLTNFRNYLAAQTGVTPSSVGYPSGFSTVPGPLGHSKENGTLAERTLYYWSMRWFSYISARLYADCSDALKAKVPGVFAQTNWNHFSGMLWKSLDFNPTAGPDSGAINHDWHEFGRLGGFTSSGDYIYEFVMSNHALRLASAAREHPQGKISSYTVVTSPGGALKGGFLKQSLVQIGRGGDRIQTYTFGPANVFKDGGGSEALINGAYAISDYLRLSRWLAETENELLAGKPPLPTVAVVAPRSAQMFNNTTQVNDGTQGNWWTTSMDYFVEALSILTALTHANIESEWMDEDHLGDAAYLARFKVIYITTPCVPVEFHSVVSTWVSGGGTLVTFPGAATYDRYNSSVSGGIPAIGGITESARNRQLQPNLAITPTFFSITGSQGDYTTTYPTPEIWRTTVGANGGTVNATFVNNSNPAVVTKNVGSGRRVHFAYFMAQTYFGSGLSGGGGGARPTTNSWDLALRKYLTMPLSLASVIPPVTIDKPLVEGLLLKSATSTVVTLLNWRAEPVTISGTIRGDFVGTRLIGRYGEIPATFAGGVVTFGPMDLDDCDILVVKGPTDPTPPERTPHALKILRGRV